MDEEYTSEEYEQEEAPTPPKTEEDVARETERYNIAIEIANGNVTEALSLMDGERKDVWNIRARFFAGNLQIYGCTSIFYYASEGTLLGHLSMVNYDKETFFLPPTMNWREFLSRIEHMLLHGKVIKNLNRDFQQNLVEILGITRRDEFHNGITENDRRVLDDVFDDVLFRSFKTQNYDIELLVEPISIVDFKMTQRESFMKAEAQQVSQKTADGKVDIHLASVLDPVEGIAISRLLPGDVIFVTVDDRIPAATSYLFQMEKKYGKKNPEIPVVVTGVERREKETVIHVRLEDNLVGTIVETEPVKVMEVTPSDAGFKVERGKAKMKSNVARLIFFILLAIGTGALLIALIMILLD